MKKMAGTLLIFLLAFSIYTQAKDACCKDFADIEKHCCFDNETLSCECKITSKSFLSIRPFFEAASPVKVALIRQAMQELRINNGSLFQVVPFGGQLIKPERLAWYFGPSCKRILLVREQDTPDTDIISTHLNIVTENGDFESKFYLTPEQTYAGIGLNYRTHFGCKDHNPNDNRGFFIDITLPIYYVHNTMNLEEHIINNGGGPADPGYVGNVKEAFRQEAWCYGKIDDCYDTTAAGVSEIDAQIGYGWGREQGHMHSYLGILIPTGNAVKGCKLFEPIIGWNKNFGVHFGSSLGIKIWQDPCKDWSIWYELAIDSRCFFKNRQTRSFDLKCKPWSRYMMIYCNKAQATQAEQACNDGDILLGQQIGTPGINLFTQEVHVSPRYQRTYNTAFVLDLGQLTLEGGYNFFCRDEECVTLACDWDTHAGVIYEKDSQGNFVPVDGPALKSVLGCGMTDSVQTIAQNYNNINAKPLGSYAENIITAQDLDLSSAEAPCLLSNRVYGSLGYSFDTFRFRTLLGFGGEYEFSGDNTGINRWGIWSKLALIF